MLVGRILPLAVSLVATPFVIRFLGAEKYGVLILVGLIPAYFNFADFGMSVASTKFGADAYAEGDLSKEAGVVQTAATIAFLSSITVALPIFIFSGAIMNALNVPLDLQGQGSLALKITSVGFVLNILASVVNTPQLARMRMDLTTFVSAGSAMLMSAAIPIVLFLGGGIVEAVWIAFFAAVVGLIGQLFIARKLLPKLFNPSIDRRMFRPLLKFGGTWLLTMLAAVMLVNLEKLFLTHQVSVRALAYYSVAFTFAAVATLFSSSMLQTLIPAFSQLLSSNRKEEFETLFARSMRLSLVCLLPTIMYLFVIAKPFFTIWAGAEFGESSTISLYILLIGLLFSVVASVPFAAIVASGKTGVVTKLLWLELIPFMVSALLLISWLGIIGAAIAWSARMSFDSIFQTYLAKKSANISYIGIGGATRWFFTIIFIAPPMLFAVFVNNFSPWLIVILISCTIGYSVSAWKTLITLDEKTWILIWVRNQAFFGILSQRR